MTDPNQRPADHFPGPREAVDALNQPRRQRPGLRRRFRETGRDAFREAVGDEGEGMLGVIEGDTQTIPGLPAAPPLGVTHQGVFDAYFQVLRDVAGHAQPGATERDVLDGAGPAMAVRGDGEGERLPGRQRITRPLAAVVGIRLHGFHNLGDLYPVHDGSLAILDSACDAFFDSPGVVNKTLCKGALISPLSEGLSMSRR